MSKQLGKFLDLISQQKLRFQNQFKLDVFSEGGTTDISFLEDLDLYAVSASLPGKTVDSVDVFHFGQAFRLPNKVTFEGTFDVEVLLDTNMKIHRALKKWQDEFGDMLKGGGGDKRIPKYNLRASLLNHDLDEENPVEIYVIRGVYPSVIAPIALSHEGGEISKVSVTFAYQYWYYERDGDPLG